MKHIRLNLTLRKLYFIIVFAIAGCVSLQIPVTRLAGSQVTFTIYDAFAPIAGAFIGSISGVVAVFLMQLLNFFWHGAQIQDAGTVIRFATMMSAALYFAKKSRFNLFIPMIAIVAFVAHPIGRTVWYYAAFWIIPIGAYFLRDRFLLARALGTTFTAHAVGGALWIWTFALPAAVWNSLIPVVAGERLLFALGICASFVAVNNLLCLAEKQQILRLDFPLNPHYLLPSFRAYYEAKRSPLF